jgi:hypothetical protein
MRRIIITTAAALALGLGGAVTAVAPQAQADAACGALGGLTVHVVAGRDVPCQQAYEVMRRYVAGEPVGWTCGGTGRGSWCTSPPDARIELR